MKKTFLTILILAVLSLALAGCSGQNEEVMDEQKQEEVQKITLGIIPSENANETLEQFKDLIAYLENEMGVEIEPYVASDYNGVVEAMRTKHVDIAFYGPFSYIMAAQRADAEALVKRIGEGNKSAYDSYFITKADSGIESIEDAEGKVFAFTDPGSTSGGVIPSLTLKEKGIDPNTFFGNVIYSGGHDASVLAVKNGSVDLVAVDEFSYARALENNVIQEGELRIVYQNEPIPQSLFAASKDLDSNIKNSFAIAMMKAGKEVPDALEPLKSKGYELASDEDYKIIYDAAEKLNLDLEK